MDKQTHTYVKCRVLCMIYTMFNLPFSMWMTTRLHDYQQQILTASEINTFLSLYFSKHFHDNSPYVLVQEIMFECNIWSSIWNWWSHITLSSQINRKSCSLPLSANVNEIVCRTPPQITNNNNNNNNDNKIGQSKGYKQAEKSYNNLYLIHTDFTESEMEDSITVSLCYKYRLQHTKNLVTLYKQESLKSQFSRRIIV